MRIKTKTRLDTYSWLILSSVFFIPLQIPLAGITRLAPTDFFILLASLMLLGRLTVTRRSLLIAPMLFPLVMIYGAMLGGVINGEVLSHAIIVKVIGSVVLLVSLLNWQQFSREKEHAILQATRALLLGSVVFTIIGMVEFFLGINFVTQRFIESRFAGGYYDPNHYGSLTAVGLVLLAAMGKDLYQSQYTTLVFGGILTIGLLLSISRGAWIVAVLGLAVVAVMRPIKIRPVWIILSGILVVAVIFSPIPEMIIEDIDSRPDNVSHRLILIQDGLNKVAQSNYLGIGLSVFLEEHEIIIHNSAIWMLVEMGALGFLAYLIFIAEPILRIFRIRLKHKANGARKGDFFSRATAGILAAHIVMAIVSFSVEATYQRQWWLILAFVIAISVHPSIQSNRVPKRKKSVTLGGDGAVRK